MKTGKTKKIKYAFTGRETMDGAGVRLKRIFGGPSAAKLTDPFLLLDHFGSSKPEEYLSGFPWHPHRGIETVTYLLEGKVYHEDSEGNKGVIRPNDLQWMTAGSGIFHEEMPKPLDENDPDDLVEAAGLPTNVTGFQLWINLPAKHKMTMPTYRGFKGGSTPRIETDGGAEVKVIAGEYGGVAGPLNGKYGIEPTYLDVKMPEESSFGYKVKAGHNSLLYIVGGKGRFSKDRTEAYQAGQTVVYSEDGEGIEIQTEGSRLRFILLSGKPLNEPIHWYGPIVMNSDDQLREAISDLQNNRFVRVKSPAFED